MKLLLLLSILAIGTSDRKVRFDNYSVRRVVPRTDPQVWALKIARDLDGFVSWRDPELAGQIVDAMVSPLKVPLWKLILKVNGLSEEVLIENVQKLIDEEDDLLSRRPRHLEWTNYHNLDEFNAWMENKREEFDFVNKIVIGKSFEGRDINALEITFDDYNPTVFIEAGIHAREWISPAATSYMVNKIIQSNWNSIFRQFNYVYVPILNPDGYVYSWEKNRLWRKNRHSFTLGNCHGVDLNRNWDYHWGALDYTELRCLDHYQGEGPFSESETRAVSNYLQENAGRKNIDLFLSFRGYSQMLLHPRAFNYDFTPRTKTWERIGRKVVEAMKELYGTKFNVNNYYRGLNPQTGTSLDWYYNTFNATIAFTYQLRDTGKRGYFVPAEHIELSGRELVASLKKLLEEYTNIHPGRPIEPTLPVL